MSYKVQFVGLVCFYREHGTRLALFPDGREPGDGIDPHYATIVVHEDWIEGAEGWEGIQRNEPWVFPLDPCEVFIDGMDAPGSLDVSEHEGRLPQLREIDPGFEINPATAQTIARVRIRKGKLTAHLIPQGEAVLSQLEVPHDGGITITVKPDDGSPQRSIRVKAGAEIAIANMADGVYQHGEPRNGRPPHFKIYEKLSVRPVTLKEPDTVPQLPTLLSRNPVFTDRGPIGLYVDCSNTGCC